MRSKLVRIFIGFLVVLVTASPVFAGQVHFNAIFGLGSLIAQGYAWGLGKTDVVSTLEASGTPTVVCKNQGGNQAPGQSSPRITATGTDTLLGNSQLRKNGKAPYFDEAKFNNDEPLIVSWDVAGCPNENWTGYLGPFVFWDSATLTFKDAITGEVLATQNYDCVTKAATKSKPASVSCTPVP